MNTTKLQSISQKVRVQPMKAVGPKLDAVLVGKTAHLQNGSPLFSHMRFFTTAAEGEGSCSRKAEEQKYGKPIPAADQHAVHLVERILRTPQSNLEEALNWLSRHIIKRSGEDPQGVEAPRGGRSRR